MKELICYGAGEIGLQMICFLEHKNKKSSIVSVIDRNKNINNVHNIPVITPEEYLNQKSKTPIWITVGSEYKDEVVNWCEKNNLKYFLTVSEVALYLEEDITKWDRDYIAYLHIDGFENYYCVAEKKLDVFWDKESKFYKYFQNLDLTNTIEFACGRGRHVPMYIQCADKVTLVDVLDKNIEHCKKRFDQIANIQYYVNNGHDLRELPDSSYTSVFSYDAMVHFEFIDIYGYLKEFYRVLKNGGMALVHHSNNASNYKVSFDTGVHARNYMSKDLFAFLAYRAGFEILSQNIIDWSGVKDLDCISLLKKND